MTVLSKSKESSQAQCTEESSGSVSVDQKQARAVRRARAFIECFNQAIVADVQSRNEKQTKTDS